MRGLKGLGAIAVAALLAPGAWAATWNAKTSWGATGNGSTNDAPAIQAGVATIAPGDTVYFPLGTYLIDSTVNFSAGAIITCAPGTVLQGPNVGTDIFTVVSNTTVGGSAGLGCTFDGGGIQAYGGGGDEGQTLAQAVSNLTFSYNTFENMTYGPNNFRTNGGIFLGGGSNNVTIRYNTFSNIIPYDDGYNAAGSTYLEQYDPDGDEARAAIWFYGATNLDIEHNTFSHDYQNIKGCQAQTYTTQNLLIHHNYSIAHHRMFAEVNDGGGCGNAAYNPGFETFGIYDNYDFDAGGPYPYSGTFGFSFPNPGSVPSTGVVVYNNLLQGVDIPGGTDVGIGIEAGSPGMDVYNNTIMSQWPGAALGFGGTTGGYIQNNYGCIMTPSLYSNVSFADEGNGSTTITYQGNIEAGACPAGNASLSVALGAVTDSGGRLSATATVSTVEYGVQGVVFSIDGSYVSAVLGSGPYALDYGAAGLSSGTHSVTATVVDAVGVLESSNTQTVSTVSGSGPSGPQGDNFAPGSLAFDIAGDAADPINGASGVTLKSAHLSAPGSANTLAVGATLQFTAVCVYSDQSTTECNNTDIHGNSVTGWSSSNPAAATISSSGLATGAAAGSTNIQATIAGNTLSSPWGLTVTNSTPSLTSIAVSLGGSAAVTVGSTLQLTANCTYSNGTTTNCTTVDQYGTAVSSWTSSAPTVATVNAGGLVTGVAAGSANFSASAEGVNTGHPVVVTVASAPLQLTGAYLSAPGSPSALAVGQTLQFAAFCQYSNGATTNCTQPDIYGNGVTRWASTATGVVTVGAAGSSTAGLATGAATGSAQVQAIVGSVYSKPWFLTIQIPTVTLQSISLAATGGITALEVGATNQLLATCVYSDGSTTACNTADIHGNAVTDWSSSNPAAASISSSGLVTGVAPGTASFTASDGALRSAPLALTVAALPSGMYSIVLTGPVTFSGRVQF